jgi:hypothetical protein
MRRAGAARFLQIETTQKPPRYFHAVGHKIPTLRKVLVVRSHVELSEQRDQQVIQ